MKGKMKVLSLLLAGIMTVGMFAGCSNDGGTTTSDGGGTTGTSSTAGGDEGGSTGGSGETVQLNWYMWDQPPTAADRVVPELNKYSEEKIGITIDYKWGTQSESLQTAFSAGDSSIDLAFACNWWCAYPTSAQKNYFYDITDLVQSVTPTLYSTLPEALWEGMAVNGKIYGVPTWKDSAADQYWMGRKDILEGAGAVDDFNNAGLRIATLTPTLEKVKAWHDADPDNNAYTEGLTAPFNFNKGGFNPPTPDWDTLVGSVYIGIKMDGSNTTEVKWMFDDADVVADMKALKDWADRGLSNGKDAPQIEQEPTVCVVSSGQGWDGAQYTAWGGPTKGYETLVSHRGGPYLTSAYVQGGANVIGSAAKNPEASLKFLELVNTDETFRNMLAFGVEGDTFTRDELGRVTKSTEWGTANFGIGSMNILWPEASLPDDQLDTNQRICNMTNEAMVSSVMGFNANLDAVESEISACSSIVAEYVPNLRCGFVDDVDAHIAELKEKLEAQGLQKIIDELQSQVDAFVAA